MEGGAPIAFLARVRILLGPLQCFQGKVRTFLTVPGSRPARDWGLHSPLASRRRDALGAGPNQLFAGCPERAYFGNNTARCGVASSRAHPPAAAAAPARAPRPPQQPGGRPGGREPAELDRTSWASGERSRAVRGGPGRVGLRVFGVIMKDWGRWAVETGCRTHIQARCSTRQLGAVAFESPGSCIQVGKGACGALPSRPGRPRTARSPDLTLG